MDLEYALATRMDKHNTCLKVQIWHWITKRNIIGLPFKFDYYYTVIVQRMRNDIILVYSYMHKKPQARITLAADRGTCEVKIAIIDVQYETWSSGLPLLALNRRPADENCAIIGHRTATPATHISDFESHSFTIAAPTI